MPRPFSLGAVLTGVMVILGALGTAGAVVVVGTATALHETAVTISEAVESVRAAQELEIQLLRHARGGQNEGAPVLRGLVAEMGQYTGTQEERRLLAQVAAAVEDYLRRAPHSDAQEAALHAIDRLVGLNVVQARELRARAERWDIWASAAGVTAAVVLVVGIVLVIAWLRRSALHPILDLRRTMERRARGDASARAIVGGPIEVRDIAAGFNAMTQALDLKRRGQLAFLASLAHDIRNPLSAMSVGLGLLADDRPEVTPARRRRSVELLRRQIDRLGRLAGDLSDAAQFEAGVLELRRQALDLRGVVRDVCDTFTQVSDAHQLVTRVSDEPVMVFGDPVRFDQMLTNLVSNAIKYSPGGGRVEVTLAAEAEQVRLRVADQGQGIAPADQPLVFEPFHRGQGARDAVEGSGLGLFITRQIVLAHGGWLELSSTPGEGSTFTVVLPRLVKSVGDRDPAPSTETYPVASSLVSARRQ
jgi:two-component system, OmpR family, sensor histidine kinase MtrB